MGIVNREGALYMATGMDVSGVYKGRDEVIGITLIPTASASHQKN